MVDMKIAIDTYFSDNWTECPVHYQGMTFTQPSDAKWIHIMFTPIEREQYGFGDACATNIAQLRILSYGDTPNASLTLDGDVQTFIENYYWGTGNNVETAEPDGLGIIDLDNGVFETSTLYIVTSTK